MSDYHILDTSEDGNSVRVVFHIPIPPGSNKAGVSYRTALSQWAGPQASVVPGVGAEQTALTSGSLYEIVLLVDTNPGDTAALKLRDRLDAMFIAMKSETWMKLRTRLDYWGFSRTTT